MGNARMNSGRFLGRHCASNGEEENLILTPHTSTGKVTPSQAKVPLLRPSSSSGRAPASLSAQDSETSISMHHFFLRNAWGSFWKMLLLLYGDSLTNTKSCKEAGTVSWADTTTTENRSTWCQPFSISTVKGEKQLLSSCVAAPTPFPKHKEEKRWHLQCHISALGLVVHSCREAYKAMAVLLSLLPL